MDAPSTWNWALDGLAFDDRERTLRSVFDANPQPMLILDLGTFRYLAANQAALTLYGYSPEEFFALDPSDIRVVDQAGQLPAVRAALSRSRSQRLRGARHRTKSGQVIDVEMDTAGIVFAGRAALVIVINDLTDRVRLENELEYHAFHDDLTGLPNRALFTDRLDHALARNKRDGGLLAVLFLDIDNFKMVNDGLGHAAGDELLTAVAHRLQAELRVADTAARFGGDEFAALLEGVKGPTEVAHVCDRIAAAVSVPALIRGTSISAKVSVGVTYSTDGATSEQLLRNADVAMYGAKADGKGRVRVYEPLMHQRVAERLHLESDLRRALDERTLLVHYQPVLHPATRRIVGIEALVRWPHPVRGMIPPLDFIRLAEDSGLILPLGRWVLNEACTQVRRWQCEISGLSDLNAAVNISPRQLDDASLAADVQQALAASGLPAGRLVLEITEGVLMRDVRAAVETLRELREVGVKLAMDDFGTGQSSLSQLRLFPVDILKVDKSFIDGLGEQAMARDLLNVVATLGRSLGLDVVVEGVETAAQATIIEGLGDVYVQGYLYSPPLGAAAMTTFLTEHCAR